MTAMPRSSPPGPPAPDPPSPSSAAPPAPPAPALIRTLVVLTLISGLVDAVSYLGLGHVFTANMTGNIVILGFAAAGAPGFSVPASLASLGAFLAGAVAAGRAARLMGSRSRLLLTAMTVETGFVAVAAAIGSGVTTISVGWPRYTVIAVLAFAMGVRNATVRRLAVPDMTTTVLTMTLTGLAADSRLAGGDSRGTGRRTLSVVAMLAGAVAGAALFVHQGPGLPLLVAAVLVAGSGLAYWRQQAVPVVP